MAFSVSSIKFMKLALLEAQKGLGRTAPNPVVGAVVVRGGKVVGRGHHRQAGSAHAEVLALKAAGRAALGADLYTTLEPCSHFGRTPPCSEAILRAGIRRVFVASRDPNPLVNGKGLRRLRQAGVQVVTGLLEAQADALNRPFFKCLATGLPWVVLKAAATLDGKVATSSGESKWITGAKARQAAHRLRNEMDAVLVGSGTVLADNPRLTVRLAKGRGRNPLRIVLDSRLRLPLSRHLFGSASEGKTVVVTLSGASKAKTQALEKRGVEVWRVPGKRGQLNLRWVLKRAAQAGIRSVLVEGGPTVHAAFLRARLADELILFVAPKVLGGKALGWSGNLSVPRLKDAVAVGQVQVEPCGEDTVVRGLFASRFP
ncbi:MAG: bifunctional diaminohydroxyphosphoribosylaminopyrimidine deaminase/5-amino-6-(5-phosphoribosylamino)uracil reductase RibD [Myxococcaceae bacterium]